MLKVLRKVWKGAFLVISVALLLTITARPTYASRFVFMDVQSNGSYAGIRCGDGDINGDFTMPYDADTGSYEFFTLTRAEAALACGYV